jgi:high-affinity iron transporter
MTTGSGRAACAARPDPRARMRRVAAVVVLFATIAPARAADRDADVRRLLDLLAGVRIAYSEAFEDGEEELVSTDELEESRLVLAEARELNDRLGVVPSATLADVARRLESHVGGIELPMLLDQIAAGVTERTGVARDRRPPNAPSATRGRDLFGPNCAGCHGPAGRGDGPDAKRARLVPANFTDVVFMRRETPADFFDRITLGHRRRGMPEWSALSPLQRWDLVAFVWTLQQSDADRAEAARLWTSRCTPCHGAAGEGVAGKANDLRRGTSIERTDRALFVVLSRGPHVTAGGGLTDEQRWRLVGHARALGLGGAAASR